MFCSDRFLTVFLSGLLVVHMSFSVVSWFNRSLITDTACHQDTSEQDCHIKGHHFLPGETSNSFIFFTNCVLFFIKCSVFPTSGLRMQARNFAVLYVTLPILDTVGLNGTLFLWTLGNP